MIISRINLVEIINQNRFIIKRNSIRNEGYLEDSKRIKMKRISELERKYVDDVLANNFSSSSSAKYMRLLEETLQRSSVRNMQ